MATATAEKTERKGFGLPEAGVAVVTGSTVAGLGGIANLQKNLYNAEYVATLNNGLGKLKTAVDRAAPGTVQHSAEALQGAPLLEEINTTLSHGTKAIREITKTYVNKATVNEGAPLAQGIRETADPLIKNIAKGFALTPGQKFTLIAGTAAVTTAAVLGTNYLRNRNHPDAHVAADTAQLDGMVQGAEVSKGRG